MARQGHAGLEASWGPQAAWGRGLLPGRQLFMAEIVSPSSATKIKSSCHLVWGPKGQTSAKLYKVSHPSPSPGTQWHRDSDLSFTAICHSGLGLQLDTRTWCQTSISPCCSEQAPADSSLSQYQFLSLFAPPPPVLYPICINVYILPISGVL